MSDFKYLLFTLSPETGILKIISREFVSSDEGSSGRFTTGPFFGGIGSFRSSVSKEEGWFSSAANADLFLG